jgi:nitroimidazol reductase NimA-like FMN-containing flavoprotein (pyridoxamine 5'-phosphate oxidase superfamily)
MLVRLSEEESRSLLKGGGLARLGYVLDGEPHIVPVNYVLDGDCAYIHSLPGNKITALRANPRACLQVDEIEDQFHWRSVLAFGDFEEVREPSERNYLLSKILSRFPQLTPVEAAIAQDAEPPTVILFRIRIDKVSGVGEL